MKSKYIWHAGEWVDVTNWRPPPRKTPFIIRDTMAGAQHPATGEYFDSKSRFREVTKAHGLVEVGNDYRNNQTTHADNGKAVTQAVAQAYEMLEQGYTPPPNESLSDWGETRILGTE
jgi:hypothetical protein